MWPTHFFQIFRNFPKTFCRLPNSLTVLNELKWREENRPSQRSQLSPQSGGFPLKTYHFPENPRLAVIISKWAPNGSGFFIVAITPAVAAPSDVSKENVKFRKEYISQTVFVSFLCLVTVGGGNLIIVAV